MKNSKDNNKNDIEMKEMYKLLNQLIKDDKIKFSFYNSPLSLDLLNFCHNKVDDTIELEFRDVMAEHISELKQIMDKK